MPALAEIFPALKERVRLDRRPGQFLLSGSVRFTSKKLIRESLTGQIMNLELLPMTLSELAGGPLPNRVPEFSRIPDARRFVSRGPNAAIYRQRMKRIMAPLWKERRHTIQD